MKISSDSMGDRTRDLPVCSEVPKSTAPPRAPIRLYGVVKRGKLCLFLGAFLVVAKNSYYLRRISPTVRPFVCPSLSLYLSARLPLDEFPQNLILWNVMKSRRENPYLFKIRQNYRALYMKT
jgi:hypothetical protein